MMTSRAKMNKCVGFVDLLEPRRSESGIFMFMTRNWYPQSTLELEKQYTPQDLKDIVATSVYLDTVIEAESLRQGVRKEKLKKQVIEYLEEMGYDKKLHTIRWMGVFFLRICFMMKIKLFVSEPSMFKLKSIMGNSPVLFLPTHRSYADFCVMTYLSYHYNIDFPNVAAGMDFYSMAVIGRLMRETGAFYIRRTIVGDPLYAATLKQYVRTVVAKSSSPVEFFLEGTRSRSNKAIPPKFGMLSMSLMPFFSREVSDITIVPINISYDRLMEHSLFAYEHLGVPKPKETTGGFLKSLRSLNDHFGNIYINVGNPISLREFVQKDTVLSDESLKPLDLQQLTPEQFKKVQDVAEYVIKMQQECTVATITNLVSLVLMHSLMRNKPLDFAEVLAEVEWMIEVLQNLGATVFENDVKGSVERILIVHRKMMRLDKQKRLRLVAEATADVSNEVKKKMKGHILNPVTMATALPIIQLQLYVNPILHYMVPPAIICLIVKKNQVEIAQLSKDYNKIRKLLSHELFYSEKTEEQIFNKAIEYCIQNQVIIQDEVTYRVSNGDNKLRFLLQWSIWPALVTLLHCADFMTEKQTCEHKLSLKLIQERIEASKCHPYCLSLEAIANCLQGLVAAGALVKDKSQQQPTYQLSTNMEECRRLVSSVLPVFHIEFDRNNSVIYDERALSRL